MLFYTDPTHSNLLASQGALEYYRDIVRAFYTNSARIPNSNFTPIEAFSKLTAETPAQTSTVSWIAFPKSAVATVAQIDRQRIQLQDEYVEWHTQRDSNGAVTEIIFTTEFVEYYQALARVSFDALVAGIRAVIPGANPTVRELLGTDTDRPLDRDLRFREHLPQNPWNNGEKGILCLSQGANTMSALFTLVHQCGIPKPEIDPAEVCDNVSCLRARNSDPFICIACQNQAQGSRALSLADPVGIKILKLGGIWAVDGERIAIANPDGNRGIWQVSRGGRRAVLKVVPGLTLDGSPITMGTQVSTQLSVGVDVITAPESALPLWARTGQEVLV
ncbi:hypothetical protein IQ235_17500 [Oscillatoriales cyanobacterium LEGE 11467]|uniref:Uncharacterized protein n=1 Tax=Zarconia navalis LEGE 11467 TaxID=1828826 RepID=A0A928VYK9_9CYAN|nr:hypothetical protein [Zarconia navalis]MBE9042567.1 hypothetical protein [Zarconia navalis LEGE 11467]